jgi:hypothetical protein
MNTETNPFSSDNLEIHIATQKFAYLFSSPNFSFVHSNFEKPQVTVSSQSVYLFRTVWAVHSLHSVREHGQILLSGKDGVLSLGAQPIYIVELKSLLSTRPVCCAYMGCIVLVLGKSVTHLAL